VVKQTQHFNINTEYFITFTCFEWLSLIDDALSYKAFYKWFEYLNQHGFKILSYVIMPNHFHGILHLPEKSSKSINEIVANGKRFISYNIIKNLEHKKQSHTLEKLKTAVSERDRKKGQKHVVFRNSFDCKDITHIEMLQIKVDYMHKNPCQGKWNLAESYIKYPHSSAAFYELDEQNKWLTNYAEIYF